MGDLTDLDEEPAKKEHHLRTLRVIDARHRRSTRPLLEMGSSWKTMRHLPTTLVEPTSPTSPTSPSSESSAEAMFDGFVAEGDPSVPNTEARPGSLKGMLGCGATVVEDEETPTQLFFRGVIDAAHPRKLAWDLAVGFIIIASVILMPFR